MKVDRKICGAVYHRGSSIIKCSEITMTVFNENSSGSQYKPDSVVQGASKGTEEGRRKTN